jgi:hypothetical protein
MINRKEQFAKFEAHLAWLLKIQFPILLERASDYKKSNATTPLHHPAQK